MRYEIMYNRTQFVTGDDFLLVLIGMHLTLAQNEYKL